ncbi:MAG: TetR/AcrR family transcriptional regulator C-terminal domain-containing protein [Gracilibacteraceae bacterium]|jgi:AcrR family transcriptional regulator|nr:TetR/AcrR family transcriptional regulator C-terminal domain-containing protein [Gracilibacteraceae bacterium]
MSKPDLTKRHIAEVFQLLVANEPYSEVKVTDIIRVAQISRRAFYYHFSDKQDLVTWIYRKGLAQILLQRYPVEALICDTGFQSDKYIDCPFYYNTRTSKQALNMGDFWSSIYFYLKDNRKFFTDVLNTDEQNNLKEYLSVIYRKQIECDIQHYAGERSLPKETSAFLVDYFYNAGMGWIISSIKGGVSNLFFEEKLNPLRNLTYELLMIAIDKYSHYL